MKSQTTKSMSISTSKPNDETSGDSSMEGILSVKNLRKEFGGLVAVDDLSFTAYEQEILGFIGPNGAGKSTTFNCITGLYPPTSGSVHLKGKDITGISSHELVSHGMARTFQEFAPLEDRSIIKNVELALVSNEFFRFETDDEEVREVAARICERVGLGDSLDQSPGELPHASLVKLELCRAIAAKPDVMLVDEPFAGLTNEEVQELSEVMESLRQHGMTLIVVDHNMRGLLNLIDRAFVIQFGSKIAEGDPDEIKNDPKVQEAYLGGDEI